MAITLTTSYQKIAEVNIGVASGSKYHVLRLYGRYTSQSTANNTTTVQYQLRHYTPADFSITYYSSSQKITGDVTASSSNTQNKKFSEGETTLLTKSKDITHNNDGSKSISVGGSFTNSYFGNTVTIKNTTVNLPKINRLATVTSARDFTDEENPELSFNNPAGFTIKPWLVIKDNAGTSVYSLSRTTGITSPYTWSLTDAERTAMRNATNKQKSYKVQIGVDTYNGSTKLGNNYKEQIMTYVNAEPSQSTTFTETNQKVIDVLGTSNANTIIQNVSQLKLTSTPTVKKGATVSKITFEHNGKPTDDSTSPYEQTYVPVNNKFKVTITDSRGYSITDPTEYAKTMVEYVIVSIDSFSFKRENPTSSNIILNAQIRYKQATFGSTDNVPTIKWKLGAEGELNALTTEDYTIDSANNRIKISNLVLENVLSYKSEGKFFLYVNDLLTNDVENDIFVPKGIPTCDMGEHDFKVNGELYVADEEGKNKRNVLTEIDTLNTHVKDSGWKDLTLESTCTEGGYSGTPQYRKIGNHVYIRGSVLLTLSSTTVTFANLPEGFRPSRFFYKTNMAQGNCICRQTVSDNGKMNCEWIIDVVASTKKTSGTAWIELNIDFLTD